MTKPDALALECPTCHDHAISPTAEENRELVCEQCGATYRFFRNRPVLISLNNPLFPPDAYRSKDTPPVLPPETLGARLISAISWRLNAWAPEKSINVARKRVLKEYSAAMRDRGLRRVLIVGSGKQKAALEADLGTAGNLELFYVDIDMDADVDYFADGHDLPFPSDSFDGVITTAVLEHVLYPEKVAAEIQRVMRTGGLLYSEVPFLQQVHEGAYDFTRYTLSGHRRLFNGFSEIEAGMISGPATSLVWAIECLAMTIPARPFSRTLTRFLVRALLGWIRYLDYALVNNPGAMDGACCTFFYGKKIEGNTSELEIIAKYKGPFQLTHTHQASSPR